MSRAGGSNQIWLKREVRDLQPVVRTSLTYPIEAGEQLILAPPVLASGEFRNLVLTVTEENSIQLQIPSLVAGEFRAIVREHLLPESYIQVFAPSIVSGEYRQIIRDGPDTLSEISLASPALVTGEFKFIVITHDVYDIDSLQLASPVLVGGSFDRV